MRPRAEPLDEIRADLPTSKSHAQRAALCAAWFGAPGDTLLDLGDSDDVRVCVDALRAWGAKLDDADGMIVLRARIQATHATLDVGESGTAARALGAIAVMTNSRVKIAGAPSLARRSFRALREVALECGAVVSGDHLPLELDAKEAVLPESVSVDAADTTQVASGLVVGLAARVARGERAPHRVVVRRPRARGYLDVTCEVLRDWGAEVERGRGSDHEWFSVRTVACDRPPRTWRAPRDASAWAFPCVLAAMHRRELPDVPAITDDHPDWVVEADVRRILGGETCEDLARRPDSFPALAALAATLPGRRTRLAGVPALRDKESDRIAEMARVLTAVGARVVELPDGLEIEGVARPRASSGPIRLTLPSDHRVVMASALLGSVFPGGVWVEPARAVTKSWPGFWDWLGRYATVTDAD